VRLRRRNIGASSPQSRNSRVHPSRIRCLGPPRGVARVCAPYMGGMVDFRDGIRFWSSCGKPRDEGQRRSFQLSSAVYVAAAQNPLISRRPTIGAGVQHGADCVVPGEAQVWCLGLNSSDAVADHRAATRLAPVADHINDSVPPGFPGPALSPRFRGAAIHASSPTWHPSRPRE
jgi:hypothetical protein